MAKALNQSLSSDESASLAPEELLNKILEETSERTSQTLNLSNEESWGKYIEEIVAPYVVPNSDPQQIQLLAQVDAAIAKHLKAVLHHPDFQALEAAWRGLFFLTQRLETSPQLKLYLLDLTKTDLAADLGKSDDLRSTKLYQLLVRQAVETPGAQPWAVVAGNYTFDHMTV
ncbi:MAG: hypothetical protein GKS05_11435 [Nitrospirales bacterium]|nr:hypothetical protein [Nitrospirales bacterium]